MITDTLDIITVRTPPWMRRAQCPDSDPELFFPENRKATYASGDTRIKEAVSICRSCPVIAECLRHAYLIADEWAIMGGKTPAERKAIIRRIGRSR